MNRERIAQRNARDEALKQAQRTGIYLGSDFVGGGGIPLEYVNGRLRMAPRYLAAAKKRSRERMGARMEIEHGTR